jgi:hypothetical protein
MALRAKTRPDEAEFEGFGGSKSENENEVWADFRRNPKGRGQFSPFLRQSSLADTPVCVTPRSSNCEKLAPVATA